jgi:hypothetical protein
MRRSKKELDEREEEEGRGSNETSRVSTVVVRDSRRGDTGVK